MNARAAALGARTFDAWKEDLEAYEGLRVELEARERVPDWVRAELDDRLKLLALEAGANPGWLDQVQTTDAT